MMNTLTCQPVIFGPSITPHCPAAPWWTLSHITPANLGWYIAGFMITGCALAWISEWIRDRWELTCGRPRITRRWYGTHAQVRLRADAGAIDADRFTVIQWEDEDTAVPWLKVHKLNPETLTCWDEDSEAFWGPVTDFAPFAVRRFRPHIVRAGRLPVPRLTQYPPLPLSARLPEGVAR